MMVDHEQVPGRLRSTASTHADIERGAYIREARLRAGLSMKALALKIGVCLETLWKLESGRLRSAGHLEAIGRALPEFDARECLRIGNRVALAYVRAHGSVEDQRASERALPAGSDRTGSTMRPKVRKRASKRST